MTIGGFGLKDCLLAGLVLQVLGAVIAVVTWPGEKVADDPFVSANDLTIATEDTGNALLAVLGIGLVQVGGMLLLVAIVGFGVKLGREAARVH